MFRQLVFAWVTGNGDVHAKNVSVLASESGEWRVAPAYDVPSTIFYGDTTLALALGGSNDGVSRRRLLQFAADVGLPDRSAQRVLDHILLGTAGLCDDLAAGALPFTGKVRASAVAQLRYRRRQLQA